MRTIFNAIVLIFYLLSTVLVATAEYKPTDEERKQVEQYEQEKNEQNFIGWKGILFYCPTENQSNQVLNEICKRSNTNVDFLAASAKINLVKAKNGYELGFKSVADDYLVLEVKLTSTDKGSPSAISANLRAYKSYLKAVDLSSFSTENKGGKKPRGGDTILWEQSVIGASSGSAQNLVADISDGIEHLIKQFFTEFLKAQR